MKQYSANSGYVYQYFFETQVEQAGGVAYRFQVSADRRTWFAVEMRVPEAVLPADQQWRPQERYALAKLLLFETFDACATPLEVAAGAELTEAHAKEFFKTLGLEEEA